MSVSVEIWRTAQLFLQTRLKPTCEQYVNQFFLLDWGEGGISVHQNKNQTDTKYCLQKSNMNLYVMNELP